MKLDEDLKSESPTAIMRHLIAALVYSNNVELSGGDDSQKLDAYYAYRAADQFIQVANKVE